jgi:hypothetical protein
MNCVISGANLIYFHSFRGIKWVEFTSTPPIRLNDVVKGRMVSMITLLQIGIQIALRRNSIQWHVLTKYNWTASKKTKTCFLKIQKAVTLWKTRLKFRSAASHCACFKSLPFKTKSGYGTVVIAGDARTIGLLCPFHHSQGFIYISVRRMNIWRFLKNSTFY